MTIAEQELGMQIEERAIDLRAEIDSFVEVAACGTAAVLSPVGKIWLDEHWHTFMEMENKWGLLCKNFMTCFANCSVENAKIV